MSTSTGRCQSGRCGSVSDRWRCHDTYLGLTQRGFAAQCCAGALKASMSSCKLFLRLHRLFTSIAPPVHLLLPRSISIPQRPHTTEPPLPIHTRLGRQAPSTAVLRHSGCWAHGRWHCHVLRGERPEGGESGPSRRAASSRERPCQPCQWRSRAAGADLLP